MLKEIKGDVHIYLMYLGTLPFIIFSLSIITNYKCNFIMINRPAESIKLYALIISIFMAGIQWGLCLLNSYKYKLFILSNLITIVLWFTYQFTSNNTFILILVLSFIYHIIVDFIFYDEKIISKKYFINRVIITSIVMTNLLISLINFK
jgi:hypothetical protein